MTDWIKRSDDVQPVTTKSLTHTWRPPVRVPFESKFVQVFPDGILPKGTFSRSEMRKVGGDVKTLDTSIQFEYTPPVGTPDSDDYKPAVIQLHLIAQVTDLEYSDPKANTSPSNPPNPTTKEQS